jgi:hypothetical protein
MARSGHAECLMAFAVIRDGPAPTERRSGMIGSDFGVEVRFIRVAVDLSPDGARAALGFCVTVNGQSSTTSLHANGSWTVHHRRMCLSTAWSLRMSRDTRLRPR